MARPSRHFLKDRPLHVIQRGNNRQAIFFKPDDYARFYNWLVAAAQENGCAVHAYVLMTNHVHLLLTPESATSLPRTMQSLGRRYVQYVNREHARTGTLWEGRYRAALIDGDDYFLACSRYIELNPVRAGLCAHPAVYRWSSYRAHALGEIDALASDHPLFHRLGHEPAERQREYRALFGEQLDPAFLDGLRQATNGGRMFGPTVSSAKQLGSDSKFLGHGTQQRRQKDATNSTLTPPSYVHALAPP